MTEPLKKKFDDNAVALASVGAITAYPFPELPMVSAQLSAQYNGNVGEKCMSIPYPVMEGGFKGLGVVVTTPTLPVTYRF